ncbi:hypothetical protein BD410DRAFT_512584 [Rickenella mellea]|uniref:Uncharacterized protein n=1 Tax=Rickenella mellea TaxID=50990 RepID=A0A4Y7PSK5_9AGAM|nr:hypothetical protein BD410DRAFT_512584 [Rickenella mellea]
MERLYVTPVLKAELAQKYDIGRDWAVTAYAALGAREEPLTYEEGDQLGLKVALQIAEVRERVQQRRRKGRRYSGFSARDAHDFVPQRTRSPSPAGMSFD